MKLMRLAIFLTGITGLAMGGIMALSSLRSGQEEAVLRTNNSLKTEATELVDQFYGVLEASKNLPLGATQTSTYVVNRGVVKLLNSIPSEFETFVSTDASLPVNADANLDLVLQERILNALKNQISYPELKISRLVLGTYPQTELGNKEGIFIATPIYKTENGVTDPNTIEKVNLTFIDPVRAFGGIQKYSSAPGGAAFLVSKQGKVLAHSVSAFIYTDLKHVQGLKTPLDNLFLGAQTGSVVRYKNVDGDQEQVAFVRAGTSPFAFGVEERAKPSVLSGAWVSEQVDSGAARRNFGFMFILIAASLLAFSGISVWTSRELSKQIEEGVRARASQVKPTMVSTANPMQAAAKIAPSFAQVARASDPVPVAQATESTESLIEMRDRIAVEKEQMEAAVSGLSVTRDLARDFVAKIEKCYTLESVEKELVELSSEIAESPVLYFRYHRRNQALTLSSVAGDVKIQNYSNMQAYVRKDIELQVEQMADEGKVASISNYGPMSKLIISSLNVAHFEAWAMTSHPEVSRQSKLVGVVVILHAGMRSAQVRPLLAQILKDAGNYLYAQSNKIRPRSAIYQAANQNKLEDSKLS